MNAIKSRVLSKQIINQSLYSDNDYVVYRMRIKLLPRQSILNAVESFYHNCNCSHDCCGHVNMTPWFSTAKHSKRKEYTFELSVYRNI